MFGRVELEEMDMEVDVEWLHLHLLMTAGRQNWKADLYFVAI